MPGASFLLINCSRHQRSLHTEVLGYLKCAFQFYQVSVAAARFWTRPFKFVLKLTELSTHTTSTSQISIWRFCVRVFDQSIFAFLWAGPGQNHGRLYSPHHLCKEMESAPLQRISVWNTAVHKVQIAFLLCWHRTLCFSSLIDSVFIAFVHQREKNARSCSHAPSSH